MNSRNLILTTSLIALSTYANGAWTELETFDGEISLEYNSQKLQTGEVTQQFGYFEVISDPINSTNSIGAFSAGPLDPDNFWNDSCWWASLPEEVPADSTESSFYIRIFAAMAEATGGWSVSYTSDIETFWNDNEALMRLTGEQDLDVRSKGDFLSLGKMELGAWHELWIVMNNQANTYEVYGRGGSFGAEQVKLVDSNSKEIFGFRVGTNESLKRFCLNFSTGSETSPVSRVPLYFDDLYYDSSSVNLSTPGQDEEMWGPYPVVKVGSSKFVDTGSLLGYLDVTVAQDQGSGWVYSFTLDSWLWLTPSSISVETGCWIFVPKF